jgi:hypothetical protein
VIEVLGLPQYDQEVRGEMGGELYVSISGRPTSHQICRLIE